MLLKKCGASLMFLNCKSLLCSSDICSCMLLGGLAISQRIIKRKNLFSVHQREAEEVY